MIINPIGDIHGALDKLFSAHDPIRMDRNRKGSDDAPLIGKPQADTGRVPV